MKQPILEAIKNRRLYFDGGYGATFQSMGLPAGVSPETWNITNPEAVLSLHKAYLAAGATIIKSNTFGANPLKSEDYREWIRAGMKIARDAIGNSDAYLAFDVGPSGKLLAPFGDLDFEDAVSAYSEAIREGAACGADLILIETMNDAYEVKAAVLAAKEVCSLPVFVTCVFDAQGKMMTGADPETVTAILEGLGADVIGMNCSLGPEQLLPLIRRMRAVSSLPIAVNPNAGLPTVVDGKTVFALDAEAFSKAMILLAEAGVSVLGGCCGTKPEYIARTADVTKDIPLPEIKDTGITVVSSYTHTVQVGKAPILIGERINPTGKKMLKEALLSGNTEYLLGEAVKQIDRGVHILDVNVGVPGIDEKKMMTDVVGAIQGMSDLPLQLDSSDPSVLAAAMRRYNGKPLVNSVNGKTAVMEEVFPLIKKYGGVVIALTLDENGIPETAEERVSIAHRIIKKAAEYGIGKKNIIVDPLALTVSSNPMSASVTLDAIRILTKEGIRTSLGVSNISFGLPHREIINAAFFTESLTAGLSMAIMNPLSDNMMEVYYAHNALAGLDEGCGAYISYAGTLPAVGSNTSVSREKPAENKDSAVYDLKAAIIRGISASAEALAREKLASADPISLISDDIIPALNEVGSGFESGKLFLPQLLRAADAASCAFHEVQNAMKQAETPSEKKPFILATVYGDVHDIGKNIVRVLLESYGFTVLDLGKNVPASDILSAVKESGCRIVGLSALMTTTVPAMEETVRLLHGYDPSIRVIVGGAVLTADYAAKIGADAYAKDAMDTVRYVQTYYEKPDTAF